MILKLQIIHCSKNSSTSEEKRLSQQCLEVYCCWFYILVTTEWFKITAPTCLQEYLSMAANGWKIKSNELPKTAVPLTTTWGWLQKRDNFQDSHEPLRFKMNVNITVQKNILASLDKMQGNCSQNSEIPLPEVEPRTRVFFSSFKVFNRWKGFMYNMILLQKWLNWRILWYKYYLMI